MGQVADLTKECDNLVTENRRLGTEAEGLKEDKRRLTRQLGESEDALERADAAALGSFRQPGEGTRSRAARVADDAG